jgi:NAD(P)-dependent dehydrogenase (short-subunit alcohol dehydrogenase family)
MRDGRSIAITGAASGIGEWCARAFAAQGARIAIADVDETRGVAVAESIVASGGEANFLFCDVRSQADVAGLVESITTRWGRLDVMVNNAGIAPAHDDLLELAEADFDQIVQVNMKGVFFGIQAAASVMIEQGSGNIINMASIGALAGVLGGFAYDTTKAGVVKMTILAAARLAPHGVRVNAICPGVHLTPLAESRSGGATREEIKARFAAMQPIARAGMPQDIADAALWLGSEQASFVTGQSIVVDGGLVVSGWGARQAQLFNGESATAR